MSLHSQPLFSARHRLFFLALLASHFVSGTQAYIYIDETDQERHDRDIQRIIAASITLALLLLIIPAYYIYARRKRRAQAVIIPPMAQYPFQGGPMYGPGPGYYAPPAGAPPNAMQPPAAPSQAHVPNNAQDGPSRLTPGSEMV
ncbi:hypothetical protein GGX14DRAFT_562439 [Mycena pura]|uniref:Uncharacterized protein n=1 Tax=Mycena pura TaxID=153505 RepID=A0AAD6VPL8_9AGAR|nr:hypothetical protein GGX14DRAFT_562439 [Mycena pura]